MLTTIPFSGFYDSLHSSQIDDSIKQMFTDRDTGCIENEGLEMRVFNACNYGAVYREYARAYCREFAGKFGVKVQYERMKSPREYNFTTDVVFATISESEALRVFNSLDKTEFSKVCVDMFTSRGGFSSFYSPNWENWGPLETWDHNQLGAVMVCVAGPDFDQWREYDLMEDYSGNGYLTQWIDNWTPGIERLYKIYDYLETRGAR